MIINIDMKSSIPIYVQLRNQIVVAIGTGKLNYGEQLPTVRQLASEIGINNMTVSKAYTLLQNEGFVVSNRRSGVVVNIKQDKINKEYFATKSETELKLLLIEAKICGLSKDEILGYCNQIIKELSL